MSVACVPLHLSHAVLNVMFCFVVIEHRTLANDSSTLNSVCAIIKDRGGWWSHCTRAHKHTHTRTHTHARTHTHTHARTHKHTHTHTHPETDLLAIDFQAPVMEEICSCWLCVFVKITGAEVFPDALLPRHHSTDCSLWEHTYHSKYTRYIAKHFYITFFYTKNGFIHLQLLSGSEWSL